MARVRPLQALRPAPAAAAAVAAVPYDVVSTAEARALAAGNPLSFLRVTRAEIDLPATCDPVDAAVYRRAAANLAQLQRQAPLVVDEAPAFYVYRLARNGHRQTGLAAGFSLAEYDQGLIKRHERTRPDKEADRTRHMLALKAQTGIVCLLYRDDPDIAATRDRVCEGASLYDFVAPDQVRHTVWRVEARETPRVTAAFARVSALYIADGHHRIASAASAREELAPAAGADAPAGVVLGVAFPDSEVRILPYNRTMADLAGLTPNAFLRALGARAPVVPDADPLPAKGRVSVYVGGRWYGVELDGRAAAGVAALDAARLQDQILGPLLKVADIRTDPRIRFVGGARGTRALSDAVDAGRAAAAFSLAPVTTGELLAVADSGTIMPPKSTWFEPKLRDGLLIHRIA